MDRFVGSILRSRCGALRCIVAILPAAIVWAIFGSTLNQVDAQVANFVSFTQSDDEATPPSNFAFLKADSRVVELIDDFRRYSGKKSWELAFHALNSINEAGSTGSVPAGSGFLVPVRVRVQQLLLKLPPDGREAYRLFNDASAKQLWQHVQNTRGGVPADEMETLHKLVDRYFLTSVGDLAADRLGDALFEQGDFASAEGDWRLVVEQYPDSHLSLAKLQCKRCVAFSLLGRRDALESLAAQVREKYGDQNVTLGGREVNAAEFAEALVSKASAAASVSATLRATVEPDELNLPAADEPLWQIAIAPPDLSGQTDPQTGWPIARSTFRKPTFVAIDGNRLYGNMMGIVYAADLETGKMLWRTDKFTGIAQQAMRMMQTGTSTDACYVVAAGDKLLVGCVGSKNMLGQLKTIQDDNSWHMDCLDAKSGKTVWSFRRAGMSLVSPPLVARDVIYALGVSNNNSMNLLCIRLTNGVTQWLISLGTPQNSRNWRGNISFGGPTLLQIGSEIYIATDSGAFFAVNPASHQIDWTFQHQTKPAEDNNGWWGQPPPTIVPSAAILNRDGIFYLKDGSSQMLYALDLATPALKWKRLVAADDSIAAIDGQTAYMLGHDLSALDLETRKLLWSTRLPGEAIPSMAVVCPRHVFVPTERGIFDVDPSDGDVRRMFRGADRESGASRLILTGNKLIATSETTVTAYPIERPAPGKIRLRTTKN